jgi:hypothetical protein
MNIFIGMETSGALRQRFQAAGHFVISVDHLPAEDGAGYGGWEEHGGHVVGDVFGEFAFQTTRRKVTFDLGIFHPDCTYLTNSAAWAFTDGPYHQKVKPETLVGAARRAARESALQDVRQILALPIKRKALENPIGAITRVRKASQIVQPYQFGDDASKGTVLILENLPPLVIVPERRKAGREVMWDGKMRERWSNQTDSGQNNMPPRTDRWKDRSRTWPGIANAMVEAWGALPDEVQFKLTA